MILVGTGTEVALCVDAAAALKAAGCPARVVSMPCWSLFDAQTAEYRESVFPAGAPILSVEALSSIGWEKVRSVPRLQPCFASYSERFAVCARAREHENFRRLRKGPCPHGAFWIHCGKRRRQGNQTCSILRRRSGTFTRSARTMIIEANIG